MVNWESDIENNENYQNRYKNILELYTTNKQFKDAANNTTKEVLSSSSKDITNIESVIEIGVHYLLSEFAFMEFATTFLKAEKITYIYHKNWPVYESYIEGKFDSNKRNYLGFEIITV